MKSHLKQPVQTNNNLRPFDEPLFYSIGKHRPEIMEDFMRVLLNDDSIEFKDSAVNIIPAEITPDGLMITEFCTYTKSGTHVCFITDKYDAQNLIYKIQWYEDYKTMQFIKDNTDYSLIPDMIFIVLMEKDSFNDKEAVYEMIRHIKGTDEVLDDGLKILYINGEYKGNDKLGDYIHDFICDDADDMRIDSIKEAVKYFESIGE